MHFLRICFAITLLTGLSVGTLAQAAKATKTKLKPVPHKRLPFPQAKAMLATENEGNVQKQVSREVMTFSLTRLTSGQLLELYYPITSNMPNRKAPAVAPGYGVLWESEAAYHEAKRPRHALEELIPDARAFIAEVPQLVARLEKRLHTRLDYSRASLRRLDTVLASYQGKYGFHEMSTALFQEMTAYYGETLSRTLGKAEWVASEDRVGKTQTFLTPNLHVTLNTNRRKVLKPWSHLLTALYDEEKKGTALTKAFDADTTTP